MKKLIHNSTTWIQLFLSLWYISLYIFIWIIIKTGNNCISCFRYIKLSHKHFIQFATRPYHHFEWPRNVISDTEIDYSVCLRAGGGTLVEAVSKQRPQGKPVTKWASPRADVLGDRRVPQSPECQRWVDGRYWGFKGQSHDHIWDPKGTGEKMRCKPVTGRWLLLTV